MSLLPDAVLFDMDGLLIDTEPLWTVAEEELAHDLGGSWEPELKALIVGTRIDAAVPTILRWFGAPDGPEAVRATSDRLLGRMVELFAQDLVVLPGVRELLAALRTASVPVALVSSSYRVLVDAALAQGVGPFDTTLAGDEVARAKPDPEPYLTAAERLGVSPQRCVVLEDSPSGVRSGEAAGCAVVMVPSVAGAALEPGMRRLVLPSLTAVTVDVLGALVAAADEPAGTSPPA